MISLRWSLETNIPQAIQLSCTETQMKHDVYYINNPARKEKRCLESRIFSKMSVMEEILAFSYQEIFDKERQGETVCKEFK